MTEVGGTAAGLCGVWRWWRRGWGDGAESGTVLTSHTSRSDGQRGTVGGAAKDVPGKGCGVCEILRFRPLGELHHCSVAFIDGPGQKPNKHIFLG